MELVRNDDYFEAGKPKLDAVSPAGHAPKAPPRSPPWKQGRYTLSGSCPSETVDRLKKNPDIVVDEVTTSSWDGIIMNNNKKPFDDLRVRKALHLAHRQERGGGYRPLRPRFADAQPHSAGPPLLQRQDPLWKGPGKGQAALG